MGYPERETDSFYAPHPRSLSGNTEPGLGWKEWGNPGGEGEWGVGSGVREAETAGAGRKERSIEL
jgi:hypothetical protein